MYIVVIFSKKKKKNYVKLGIKNMLGRNADLKCVGYAMQGVVRTSRDVVKCVIPMTTIVCSSVVRHWQRHRYLQRQTQRQS